MSALSAERTTQLMQLEADRDRAAAAARQQVPLITTVASTLWIASVSGCDKGLVIQLCACLCMWVQGLTREHTRCRHWSMRCRS